MRITQQDIARTANVSQATVSRVLSGDTKVDAGRRAKVLAAIEESHYQPDVRAQSLRQRRTHLIGLVYKNVPELIADPFFSSLVSEIIQMLAKTPYRLCLDLEESIHHHGNVYDDLLRSRRVDGLIVVEPKAKDARLKLLKEDDFPFVVLGNPRGDARISVDNDNVLAARLATQHLVDQGFTRIGMIAGPEQVVVSQDRLTGYLMTLHEHGLQPMYWHCEFGFRNAANLAQQVLKEPERPEALVVLEDAMGLGVVQGAREIGLRVPDDLAVVCFNVSKLCEMGEGGLSSVDMKIQSLVQLACEKLIDLIEARMVQPESRTVIPCELVIRRSSIRQTS